MVNDVCVIYVSVFVMCVCDCECIWMFECVMMWCGVVMVVMMEEVDCVDDVVCGEGDGGYVGGYVVGG